MDLTDYKKAFAQAHADLEKLVEEREEIDRKISKLKQAIVGLAPLADEAGDGIRWLFDQEFGITDGIREVLSSAEKPLTPLEVRDRLAPLKPGLTEQANLMASIHTILKRLVPKEAESSTNRDGDVVYLWIGTAATKKTLFNEAALKAARKYVTEAKMPPVEVSGLRMPPVGLGGLEISHPRMTQPPRPGAFRAPSKKK